MLLRCLLACITHIATAGDTTGSPMGSVVAITQQHSFVDVGSRDGVRLGMRLQITRGNGAADACAVDALGPHQARCTPAVGQVGSSVHLSSEPQPPNTARPLRDAEIAQVLPSKTPQLTAPLRATSATRKDWPAWQGVAYQGRRRPPPGVRPLRAWVGVQHDAFVLNGLAPLNRQQERVDAAIRGYMGFGALEGAARATLLAWPHRSPPTRYLPRDAARLLVWELGVMHRDPGSPWTLAAGRVLPWFVPGLGVIDGAQAGLWRGPGGTELGVYGGAAPEVQTLLPSLARVGAGAYANLHARAGDALLRLAARGGWLALQRARSRLELEATASLAWHTWLSADINPRVAWLPDRGIALEALRADVHGRWGTWGAGVSGRYNSRLSDEADGYAGLPGLNDVTAADASVNWQPFSHLRLTALASLRNTSAGSPHLLAGPGVEWLEALPGRGSLALSGAWENNSAGYASLQANWRADAWRLLVRGSGFADLFMGGHFRSLELALYARGEARLLTWLRAYASLLARPQLGPLRGYDAAASFSAQLGALAEL